MKTESPVVLRHETCMSGKAKNFGKCKVIGEQLEMNGEKVLDWWTTPLLQLKQKPSEQT